MAKQRLHSEFDVIGTCRVGNPRQEEIQIFRKGYLLSERFLRAYM